MADEAGKWCEEQPLNTKWKNDFERGNVDVYHVEYPELGKITDICIRRDETSANDSWHGIDSYYRDYRLHILLLLM